MVYFVIGSIFWVLGIAVLTSTLLGLIGNSSKKNVPHGLATIPKQLCAYSATTIGTRKVQQDSSTKSTDENCYRTKHNGILAAVCDGMGGMEGGEIASHICAECLYNEVIYLGSKLTNPYKLLESAINKADISIAALKTPDDKKMKCGTTAVAAIVYNDVFSWVSVGDSRIYQYDGRYLKQITRDHNYMLDLSKRVEEGTITLVDAENHPQAEALISYVGMGGMRLVDHGTEICSLQSGRVFLLCSDGLYKALADIEIEQLLQKNMNNLRAIPQKLIDAVENKRPYMALDNTTVVVVGYGY